MDRVENHLEGARLFRKLPGRQGWRYIHVPESYRHAVRRPIQGHHTATVSAEENVFSTDNGLSPEAIWRLGLERYEGILRRGIGEPENLLLPSHFTLCSRRGRTVGMFTKVENQAQAMANLPQSARPCTRTTPLERELRPACKSPSATRPISRLARTQPW